MPIMIFFIIDMSHLYYYIEAGSSLDLESRFLIVSVGRGVQADRDYLFLLAYAVEHGCYFELRSAASSVFVSRVADSLGVFLLPFRAVTARQLAHSLRAGLALPDESQEVVSARAHFLRMTNLDFRISERIISNRG